MPMSDVPRDDPFCGGDVVTSTLTFDDAAAGPIPPNANLTSGTYQPTNNDTFLPACAPPGGDTDSFSGPAPGGPPYGSTMSVFNGTNPNGVWSLYVHDDAGGDPGSITGGWSLNIDATAAPAKKKCKKKKKHKRSAESAKKKCKKKKKK